MANGMISQSNNEYTTKAAAIAMQDNSQISPQLPIHYALPSLNLKMDETMLEILDIMAENNISLHDEPVSPPDEGVQPPSALHPSAWARKAWELPNTDGFVWSNEAAITCCQFADMPPSAQFYGASTSDQPLTNELWDARTVNLFETFDDVRGRETADISPCSTSIQRITSSTQSVENATFECWYSLRNSQIMCESSAQNALAKPVRPQLKRKWQGDMMHEPSHKRSMVNVLPTMLQEVDVGSKVNVACRQLESLV